MKLLKHLSTSLSAAIIVVCCALFLIFGISGTGWKALAIPTGSMRPDIPPGSLVLVHRVPISSLKIGDVITYVNPLKPKTTLTHRIVKEYMVNGKVPGFITKGDANKFDDVPITEGAIEGKVLWHAPHVGYWLIDSKNPLVILPIIYIVTILIMAEEIIRLKDYLKSKQPFVARGFKTAHQKMRSKFRRRVFYASGLTALILIISGLSAPVALALLKSSPVALGPNNITIAQTTNQCSTSSTNNNNVSITNNNSQSSSSGAANNSGGGSATSGNSSNSSTTNVNVTITNTNC